MRSWTLNIRVVALVALAGVTCGDPDGQVRLHVTRPDGPLSADTATTPLTEPHLAVSPIDTLHLVVAAIVAPTDSTAPWRCTAFVSFDAGRSWRRHDFSIDRCIDPWVSFTPDGDVLLVAIELGGRAPSQGGFRLLGFRSTDGGRTWSERISLGTGHEHAMTFVEAGGTGARASYLLSRRMYDGDPTGPRHTLALRRSTDDGRTFDSGHELHPFDRGLTATGLAFLTDGRIAVGFHDFVIPDDGIEPELRMRAWVYRSETDGSFERAPHLIADRCGTGATASIFPGHPAFLGDGSDHLYHACIAADLDAVLVSRSADGGVTWDPAVRVAAAEGGAPTVVGTPMLAVGATGTLGVAWYDRRHDPDRACQDFFFTASTDRGRTFAPPHRISTETSCPLSAGNGRAGRSWAFGGDYTSIAARGNAFQLVWADSRSGRFALRQAVVRVDAR